MFKKVLYVILAIAFLVGTHLIAEVQNQHNNPPDAQPKAYVSAGVNEAVATASLDPVREALVEVGNPISFTGEGYAYALVSYYFSDEADRSPVHEPLGEISVTLTATEKPTFSASLSSSQNHEETADADSEVDISVGSKKGKIGAGVDMDASVELTEESESETNLIIQLGIEKEVTAQHDNQEARVEGNENDHKGGTAYARYINLRNETLIDSDNDSYIASFLERLSFW